MHTLLPEFFLAIAIIVLLVFYINTLPIMTERIPVSTSFLPDIPFGVISTVVIGWTCYLYFQSCYSTSDFLFIHDDLAIWTKIWLCLGILACFSLGRKFNHIRRLNSYEYYTLILISFLGICLLASSKDLLSLYLSLEMQSLSFYVLASFQRQSGFSTEAGLKYFLLGAISSGFLLLGISWIYGLTGTTNLDNLYSLVSDEGFSALSFSLLLFSFGLFFKLGAVPFHMWVPDVYEGSPDSVSIFFAVVPKLSFLIIITRVIFSTFILFSIWQKLLLVLAVSSIFWGALMAYSQTKSKRLLSYSGISHVGYSLIALASGTLLGGQAILIYISLYILTSFFLWILILSFSTKSYYYRTRFLTDTVMLTRTNPVLGWTAVLVVFSLAGIPPLGGFFAKLAVFQSSIDAGFFFLSGLVFIIGVISMVYYLGLIKLFSFEKGFWGKTKPLGKSSSLILGIFGIIVICFVLFANFISLFTYFAFFILSIFYIELKNYNAF